MSGGKHNSRPLDMVNVNQPQNLWNFDFNHELYFFFKKVNCFAF